MLVVDCVASVTPTVIWVEPATVGVPPMMPLLAVIERPGGKLPADQV